MERSVQERSILRLYVQYIREHLLSLRTRIPVLSVLVKDFHDGPIPQAFRMGETYATLSLCVSIGQAWTIDDGAAFLC